MRNRFAIPDTSNISYMYSMKLMVQLDSMENVAQQLADIMDTLKGEKKKNDKQTAYKNETATKRVN